MRIGLLLTTLLIFASNTVLAKSVDDKVKTLEGRVKQIEGTYLENNKDIADAINDAKALSQDAASLKGKIEANTHMMESQRTDILRHMQDIEHRLEALEQSIRVFSYQMSKALQKVSPRVASEGDMYLKALEKVEQGSYMEALSYFKKFLAKHKKSKFAADARYWIPECRMQMREFKLAIKGFQIFIEKYPRHDKVPAAIYKQGIAFKELGLKEDSKVFFQQVIKKHPKSPWAEKAKKQIAYLNKPVGEAGKADPLSSYPNKTIQQKRNGNIKEGSVKPNGKKKPRTTSQRNKASEKWDQDYPRGGF